MAIGPATSDVSDLVRQQVNVTLTTLPREPLVKMTIREPDDQPQRLHIFPTTNRSKHSKTVSYPVGAEQLSRALADVPQAGAITCSFTAGSNAENRPDLDNYLVLQASYGKRPRMFHDGPLSEERGVYEAKWHICVFAVPTDMRHAVKLLLINEALPNSVRSWFLARGTYGVQTGGEAIWIRYLTETNTVSIEEHGKLDPERVKRA